MANNSEILGEEAAVRQIVENDFSATNGHFEDDSVTMLRDNAFRGRNNLKSASFPNLTSKIGSSCFSGCTKLETINLPKYNANMNGNIFYGCSKLKRIALPAFTGNTTQEAFRACPLLNIADFGMCTSLSGTNLIYECTSLVTIVLRRSTVCALVSTGVFSNTKYAADNAGGAYVYVPRDLIPSYQAATNWSTLYAAHSDMFRALEDYTVDGTTTGELDLSLIDVMPTPIYTLSNQTLTGSTFIDTGIQLFDTTNPEFTIIADMTMNSMGSMNQVAFNCWDTSSATGFKAGRSQASANLFIEYRKPGTSSSGNKTLTAGFGNRTQMAVIIKKASVNCYYYRNGVYDTYFQNNGSTPSSTLNRTLVIGGETSGNFVGVIHDFKLYNKALNIRQVESILGNI